MRPLVSLTAGDLQLFVIDSLQRPSVHPEAKQNATESLKPIRDVVIGVGDPSEQQITVTDR